MDYTSQEMSGKTFSRSRRTQLALVGAILLGSGLRMYDLARQPLSWDEGWSLALRTLPLSEINRITALDVHPPLYYYALKAWRGLGVHESPLRFLSVMAGVALIPLVYAFGRLWRDEKVGLFGACLSAFAPLLVYYSQVIRMYSLCAFLSLLACYCLLKAVATGEKRHYAAFVCCAAAAIYTFYYAAFVVAAAVLYSLLLRPQKWRNTLSWSAGVVALYMPWLLYAVPAMAGRVESRTGFAFAITELGGLLRDGVFGLVFAYGAGWIAVYVVAAVVVLGLAVDRFDSTRGLRDLGLPVLAILLTLLSVAVGTQAHMFAARYLIAASPFLSLALAASLASILRWNKYLGAMGFVAILVTALPTLTGYVYAKPYEVSGAFDSEADYRFLRDKTGPDDIVFFNILSLAGHYERWRTAEDPPWSYVQRWDPVTEPLEPAIAQRIEPAAKRHRRLWFVFYQGTVGPNLALKTWLDENLFPAYGQWSADTLYELYLTPTEQVIVKDISVRFEAGTRLLRAAYTPSAAAEDRVTVALDWVADNPVPQSFKVFVHLYGEDGQLLAQHDAIPGNEERPTLSWVPGQTVQDRHGLWVPAGASGVLNLAVGLYDPQTGDRLLLADGSDHLVLGGVRIGD